MSRPYLRSGNHVDVTAHSLSERDAASAPRAQRRPLLKHYLYSGGVRYAVYDAGQIVDSLSTLPRPGHLA